MKRMPCLQWLFLVLLRTRLADSHRVAVIGGGIAGTFIARYLTDYASGCELELTLYDPSALGEYTTKTTSTEGQGSRVATLKLDDGRLIELGASIISESFAFIREMVLAGNLSLIPPFQTGLDEPGLDTGFVIYDGEKKTKFSTANMTSSERKRSIAFRYSIDAFLFTRAMNDAWFRFQTIQALLADESSVFLSPQDMWEAVGLEPLTQMSIADYGKSLWVPEKLPWWREILGNQGSLQEELLSAVNLVNYNQDNRAVNALTGLASFSVVSTPSYGVEGGNVRLISSAWEQAQQKQCSSCPEDCSRIKHIQERVSTVVGSLGGFELYNDAGSLLGNYDIIILATPVSMCKIDFLIQSHIDDSVLQPMPLGKLIENNDDTNVREDHDGHAILPRSLPRAVRQSYTPVATTIVRNGVLQADYFSLPNDFIPRSVYMTAHGKAMTNNVTAISQVSASEGIYKVFSSFPLSKELLAEFFGPSVRVEYEKFWGGRHGGATPDYEGSGESTEFLLFDAAIGFQGHTKAGALYYTSALEHAVACMETSAMGAKAVAKLVAMRFEWGFQSKSGFGFGDEL